MIAQSASKIGFKLVIMNLNMPAMDGSTATLEISKLVDTNKNSHLPAIVGIHLAIKIKIPIEGMLW